MSTRQKNQSAQDRLTWTDRVPPHDLAAEQAVLGSLLIDDLIANVRPILPKPEMLYSEIHRHIYKSMLEIFDEGLPIDIVILGGRLDNNIANKAYLAELVAGVATSLNVHHWAERVREKYYLRQLLRACQGIGEAIFEKKPFVKTVSAIKSTIIEVTDEALDALAKQNQNNFSDGVRETFKDIENKIGKDLDFPTGIANLDEKIGGLCPGDLITIGGQTSTGKTALALTFCLNLLGIGKKILFLSLEMGRQELIRRFLTIKTGLNLSRSGIRLLDLDGLEKLNEASKEIGEWNLIILDDLKDEAELETFVEQSNCDLLVVDHIQLVVIRKEETRALELARLARRLKRLAVKQNIPVLALSQLRREAAKREPLLHDLRESGGIEENSDQVLLLYRPGVEDLNKSLSETHLYIAKNRDGTIGHLNLYFDTKKLRFFDVRKDKN